MSIPTQSRRDTRQIRGVSTLEIIKEAKAKVPVVDLADLLCGAGGLRRVGARWVGKCPVPGHEDRTPSFSVYLETNSWYCFGCCRGGDVVDLAVAVWDYGAGEIKMAAAHVLFEYGHEIPGRPERWHEKENRHALWREEADRVRAGVVRRRLFRLLILPEINQIKKEEERRAELERVWEEFSRTDWRIFAYWRGQESRAA